MGYRDLIQQNQVGITSDRNYPLPGKECWYIMYAQADGCCNNFVTNKAKAPVIFEKDKKSGQKYKISELSDNYV